MLLRTVVRSVSSRLVAEDARSCFVITHRFALDDAPKAYALFKEKDDGCVKVD